MSGNRADSARRRAWTAAGFILLALGILLLAIGAAGLAAAGGGLALVALAVPPVVAGGLVVRQRPGARILGLSVALAYAAVVASVAIAPWRGLTPPPGVEPAAIDPASVLVGLVFLAAALLLVFGAPGSNRAAAGH